MGQKLSRNSSKNPDIRQCVSGGDGTCFCAADAAAAAAKAAAAAAKAAAEATAAAEAKAAAAANMPDVGVADAAERCEPSTSGAQTTSKGAKKSHWMLRFNSRPKSKSTKNRVPPPSPPPSPPPPSSSLLPSPLPSPPSPSSSRPPPLDILPDEPSPTPSEVDSEPCICSRYRIADDITSEMAVNFDDVVEAEPLAGEERPDDESPVIDNSAAFENTFNALHSLGHHSRLVLPSFDEGMMDLHSDFIGEQFVMDDFEDRAYKERAKEIQEGIEPPPGFRPGVHIQLLEFNLPKMTIDNLTTLFQRAAITAFNAPQDLNDAHRVHTSIDYIHYLVPDLKQITNCSCYWGKMDRYEAERLLDNKPEGTFLLRDSAQEEYLFSVSFRKYGRSLHARIEQWNHLFSFDSRDPGVFASSTVCGLVEHYKDPTCCMFFEPMLTLPMHRNFTFSLQHACRATICNMITYDDVNQLKLPKCLKSYLKEYHYKQRVRVRIFDDTEN